MNSRYRYLPIVGKYLCMNEFDAKGERGRRTNGVPRGRPNGLNMYPQMNCK